MDCKETASATPIQMQPKEGAIYQKPSLVLRLRAFLALQAYKKAEGPFRQFEAEFARLEAEREALCRTYVSLSDEQREERAAYMEKEMSRINGRFLELAEPSQKALKRMTAAKDACDKVLVKLGFKQD